MAEVNGVVMEDEEFNQKLERILESIHQVEKTSRKESGTEQIKYRNDQLTSNRKYSHNIDSAEEK